MISFLRGALAYKGIDEVIIDVAGVGYCLPMSAKGIAALPEVGKTVRVLTHMQVREDAIVLYGFASTAEKQVFEKLITVSGVGPKVALALLSTYTPDEAISAIASQNEQAIQAVSGIGKKMASRIILELKEAFDVSGEVQAVVAKENKNTAVVRNVVDALLSMGFSPTEAELALKSAPENASEAVLLRYALKRLGA